MEQSYNQRFSSTNSNAPDVESESSKNVPRITTAQSRKVPRITTAQSRKVSQRTTTQSRKIQPRQSEIDNIGVAYEVATTVKQGNPVIPSKKFLYQPRKFKIDEKGFAYEVATPIKNVKVKPVKLKPNIFTRFYRYGKDVFYKKKDGIKSTKKNRNTRVSGVNPMHK